MTDDVHDSVGAYVIDALDAPERDAFAGHLADCSLCRREVAEFDETLAELGRLSAAAPPPMLRDRVLAGISTVQQLPPGLEADPPANSANQAPVQDRSPRDLRSPDQGSAGDELAERRQRRRTRVLTAAVAATLVIALGLGGWVVSLVRQQQALTAGQELAAAAAQRERALLSAPDARVVNQRQGAATYSFVYSKQRDEALFLGTNLADPGAGRTYQLWTVQKSGVVPDALVSGYGKTQTWLDGSVDAAGGFAVSIEPAGGSTKPTEKDIQTVIEL